MTKKEALEFNQKNVYTGISSKGYGYTYFAKNDFNPGDKVMIGLGKIIDHQTPHASVQIGFKKHYLPEKWTGKYWNHSCDPNTFVRSRIDGFPDLIAKKRIKNGEEITYAYYMTEFSWIKNADENQVKCKCGEKKCKGRILSFSQLSKKEKNKLKEMKSHSKYLMI